jgi:hypothetical protein
MPGMGDAAAPIALMIVCPRKSHHYVIEGIPAEGPNITKVANWRSFKLHFWIDGCIKILFSSRSECCIYEYRCLCNIRQLHRIDTINSTLYTACSRRKRQYSWRSQYRSF